MASVQKAVIPAAGWGTRFLPITKSVPKEMLAIGTRPALEYIVREAAVSGIREVLIIIDQRKECIKNYFRKDSFYDNLSCKSALTELEELLDNVKVSFVTQTEMNGNGAAVSLAREFVGDEPFAVMFGDDVTYCHGNAVTGQLIRAFEETGKSILGCQDRPDAEATKYGVVTKGKTSGRLTEVLDLTEKPSINELPSNLCSLGRFILKPAIFEVLTRTPRMNGEIYLTNALKIVIQEDGLFAYDFEGVRYDLGDKFGFVQANLEYALRSESRERVAAYIKDIASKL